MEALFHRGIMMRNAGEEHLIPLPALTPYPVSDGGTPE